LPWQNPEFTILDCQNPEFTILDFQNPELMILESQNPEFRMGAGSQQAISWAIKEILLSHLLL